jgi:hypothetical protein
MIFPFDSDPEEQKSVEIRQFEGLPVTNHREEYENVDQLFV